MVEILKTGAGAAAGFGAGGGLGAADGAGVDAVGGAVGGGTGAGGGGDLIADDVDVAGTLAAGAALGRARP